MPARPRQCGRCRQFFDGDPTLEPVTLPEWWLCSPCRATLFGDHTAPVTPDGEPHAVAADPPA
jgi:hypothetical protein